MLAPAFLAISLFSLVHADLTTNFNSKIKRSEPITFPIKRNDDFRDPRAVYEADMRRLRQRFGIPDEKKEQKRAKSTTVPMGNLREDVMYYTTIQIGTPPQYMDVQLDTASSDLWVYTTDCRTCKPTSPLPTSDGTAQFYNKTVSSTISISNTTVGITYAGGDGVSGVLATEVVSVGGFTVPNQTFIYVTSQSNVQGGPGIMGMGWEPNAVTNSTPWWQTAIEQFENPEFSFLLVQSNGTAGGSPSPGGQLTLGGRNQSVYTGEVSFIPTRSDKFWDVPFSKINVTPSHNVPIANSTLTVIDTGSTLVYGPKDDITAFYAGIEGAVRGETINNVTLTGMWLVPCNTTVNPEFIFGNASVVLPAAAVHMPATPYWIYKNPAAPNVTYCVGGFASPNFDNLTYWVFGDAFLKGVYTIFRKGNNGEAPSVGFARLKGVDYTGNGTLIIGSNGNGVDGTIGRTGPNELVIDAASGNSTTVPPENSTTASPGNSSTSPPSSTTPLTSGARSGKRWLYW